MVGVVLAAVPGFLGAPNAAANDCAGDHFVASWAASPTDAVTPLDASGHPVPLTVTDQTFRMIVTPHLGGSTMRLRLSNRFGVTPVTFGRVTVGVRSDGAGVLDPRPVTFDGRTSVTVPAGGEVVTDPIGLVFSAFTPLAVSIHVPGSAGPPTKHWNANATSFYSAAGSGDLTGRSGGEGFDQVTYAWSYVHGIDVEAPAATRSIVAFGDSITDGMVSDSVVGVPADTRLADTDSRYPDALQRRIDRAGLPLSVVNAGIGSNRLVVNGQPIMMGPSGIERFPVDALAQAGVAGVIVQEGINDLGLPPGVDADRMIAGFRQVVAMAHERGVKVWLGTILPASDELVNGVAIAPRSEGDRQRINEWIRTQDVADGVIDFDAALRDPANPAVLNPAFGGPDRLHPNPAGYRAMADAVDLALLAEAGPRCD